MTTIWQVTRDRTIRKVVVRFVAAALLFSLLGEHVSLALRGIKDIGVVVGALAIVAVAAWIAKKQRESERLIQLGPRLGYRDSLTRWFNAGRS